MQLTFQVTAVRLDSNTIVADVHSGGYDAQVRVDSLAFCNYVGEPDGANYLAYATQINDGACKRALFHYINYSPYLLHSLRDAIRLKEIEAVIYDAERVQSIVYGLEVTEETAGADHLHSLITQYGDGRVETEGLKVK
jgi:hypothetical protein